jgi:hypothetical protein
VDPLAGQPFPGPALNAEGVSDGPLRSACSRRSNLGVHNTLNHSQSAVNRCLMLAIQDSRLHPGSGSPLGPESSGEGSSAHIA